MRCTPFCLETRDFSSVSEKGLFLEAVPDPVLEGCF